MPAISDELLTVDDLTAYFKVNRRTVYRMLEDNELPFAIKVRGHWRFRLSDVQNWLENQKVGSQLKRI